MDKVGEEEENTIEEASNSVEEEDERIGSIIAELVDPVDSIEEGSTDPSNSHTVTFEDHDVNESEMEDEKVLEFFRRNNSVRPERKNNFLYLNKSEEMVIQFQDEVTPADAGAANLDSQEILEGIKSSDEDTSDSDFDSSPSRYYFDRSLPVSAQVEEFETHQDENKVPLLFSKQPVLKPTSWRNCCGLLQLLRAANPYNSGTINTDLR